MEAFQDSYQDAASYPSNLLFSDIPVLLLDGMRQELQREAPRLFCDESSASVDFLEVQSPGQESTFRTVRNEDDLQKILGSAIVQQRHDPMLRMIFLYGQSQLDRLYITAQMAQRIMSYHQVMPAFLDNLFMFGFREDYEDCLTTSFQGLNQFPNQRGLELPELGRFGRVIEHCYGLRSVERSQSIENWPWSIRTCSVYHSLDLESGQATWIVVKANRLVEKLVRDSMTSTLDYSADALATVRASLLAALRIHVLVGLWAGDNWPRYISFLESRLQDITRPALSVATDKRLKSIPADQLMEPEVTARPTTLTSETGTLDEKPTLRKKTTSTLQAMSQRMRPFSKRASLHQQPQELKVAQHEFFFSNLPTLHHIEERASEAQNVISNNIDVLEDLKSCYSTTLDELGTGLGSGLVDSFQNFSKDISRIQSSLRTQKTRLRQLAKLFSDRKALISKILEYESMTANRLLAEKAGITADNMEQLAVKTKLETVSMRIITLVTLFFLPGTFISTLMSTPIVKFAPGSPSISDSNVSAGALGFYCAVSVPLVVVTFAAWYLVYWWENRKEKKRQSRMKAPGAEQTV